VPDFSKYPFFTLLCVLLMSATVSGMTEEAGFRGYMQRMIARRHGSLVASIIVAVAFGFSHLTHGWEHTLPRLPYYLAVSLIYSGLVYLTGSILPGLIIHACGDALEFMIVWRVGLPTARPLIWQTGPDAAFWMCCGLGAFFGFAAFLAFRMIAASARRS
jgi:membrane protease YdiL (CAAX protease family)